MLGPAVFVGAFGLAVGAVLTTACRTLAGEFLLGRGPERGHRLVGLAAVLTGLLAAAAPFLAKAAAAAI